MDQEELDDIENMRVKYQHLKDEKGSKTLMEKIRHDKLNAMYQDEIVVITSAEELVI